MSEKILCVDDDTNILAGYKRQLRKQFKISTATGGEEALRALEESGPYAVIVSDMRMPGMNGIELLKKVREKSPDTVRLMLTGNADLQTAIEAVNEGNIFRFLTKPCAAEPFAKALAAGLEQHRLITAEKVLLRDTLTGSVKVLMDIVAMVNPTAFGRASRIRRYVKHIAHQLELPNLWEYELAGMLSQIGCVTLPSGILDKLFEYGVLSPAEQKMLAAHPKVAGELLSNIPRLKTIAKMIELQQAPFTMQSSPYADGELDPVAIGGQILKVAVDLDELLAPGIPFNAAWRKLSSRTGQYNPDVLDALMTLRLEEEEKKTREVSVDELRIGMVVKEDIVTKDESVLVSKGQEITYPLLVLLRNASSKKGVVEPIIVQVGSGRDAEDAASLSGAGSTEPVTAGG